MWDSLIHQPMPEAAGPSPEVALGPQHTCCPGAWTAQVTDDFPSRGEMAQTWQVSRGFRAGCKSYRPPPPSPVVNTGEQQLTSMLPGLQRTLSVEGLPCSARRSWGWNLAAGETMEAPASVTRDGWEFKRYYPAG